MGNIDKKVNVEVQELTKFSVNEHNYFFPLNREYSKWGITISDSKNLTAVSVKFKDISGVIKAENPNSNTSKISFIVGEQTLITFTDIKFNEEIFIRVFRSGERFYIDQYQEQIRLAIRPIQTDFIEKLVVKPVSTNINLGTFDIETIVKNSEHKAYLFSFYDGKQHFSIFSNSATELLSKLLVRKYRNFTFYAHNLSRFDLVFLFKDLAQLKTEGYEIDFLKKDDKVISIKIHNSKKRVSITLKDSILLLPMSLAKLAKQFNLEVGKLIEPVYVGEGYEEFKSDNLSHYSKEVEQISDFSIWQTKIQAYCVQDCIAYIMF